MKTNQRNLRHGSNSETNDKTEDFFFLKRRNKVGKQKIVFLVSVRIVGFKII